MDSCSYVREFYGVPAQEGMRVHIGAYPYPYPKDMVTTGVIVGADDHLYILLDGEKNPRRFHPTWCLEYLNENGDVLAAYGDTD